MMKSLLPALAVAGALLTPSGVSGATIGFTFTERFSDLGAGTFENSALSDLATTPVADAIGQDIFGLNSTLFSFGMEPASAIAVFQGVLRITNQFDSALTFDFDTVAVASASIDQGASSGQASAILRLAAPIGSFKDLDIIAAVSGLGVTGNVTRNASGPVSLTVGGGGALNLFVTANMNIDSGDPTSAVQTIINSSFRLTSIAGLPPPPQPEPEPALPVIPLPASGWLVLTALGGLALLRRRRSVRS